MAEREGFEPSIPCGIHTFQACAFGRSATSPQLLTFGKTDGAHYRQTTLQEQVICLVFSIFFINLKHLFDNTLLP